MVLRLAVAGAPSTAAPPVPSTAGGISWTVPARWTAGQGSSMRVATYAVPGPTGAGGGGGMRVTRAEVAGTYLAPGGPMMQSTGKKAGHRLLGAIVEAPGGNVFFKLTGPAGTVGAAQAGFDTLVASIRKK